jgi:(p)ppGpp synthase/HD superfamily hydrolase
MLPEWMSKILDVQKQVLDQKKFIEKLKNEVIISEIKCF